MNDNLLTPDDLAKRWHLSTHTLNQWRWTGKGPIFVKIGGRVLYRVEDIESFEKNKRFHNTTMPLAADNSK